jgi:DNA-directed RNA polymerase specialized sigma54-like protein
MVPSRRPSATTQVKEGLIGEPVPRRAGAQNSRFLHQDSIRHRTQGESLSQIAKTVGASRATVSRIRLQESAAIDYTVSELKKGFTSQEGQEQLAQAQQKQSRLRFEMERLAEAIAKSGGSDFLIEA